MKNLKIANIAEKILHFSNQQKDKGSSCMLASRPWDLACIAKASDYSNLKVLSLKQMLQRLPIALARVKAGKTSEKLLNKITQVIYRAREITEKVYSHVMDSIKL